MPNTWNVADCLPLSGNWPQFCDQSAFLSIVLCVFSNAALRRYLVSIHQRSNLAVYLIITFGHFDTFQARSRARGSGTSGLRRRRRTPRNIRHDRHYSLGPLDDYYMVSGLQLSLEIHLLGRACRYPRTRSSGVPSPPFLRVGIHSAFAMICIRNSIFSSRLIRNW